MLEGQVVALTGADGPCGHGLALGLADAGAALALLGPSGDTANALRTAGARSVAIDAERGKRASLSAALGEACAELGPLAAFVHAAVPPAALEPAPLSDTEETDWDARCDAVVREAIVALQTAFDGFEGRDAGRIVVVTPTIGMAGAARFVPYGAAAEALRGLARSAAKQWGPRGITVNCLAPPIEALIEAGSDADTGRLSLGEPPLGGRDDPRRDLAPALAFLASEASAAVTGTTLRVDGGVWMAG